MRLFFTLIKLVLIISFIFLFINKFSPCPEREFSIYKIEFLFPFRGAFVGNILIDYIVIEKKENRACIDSYGIRGWDKTAWHYEKELNSEEINELTTRLISFIKRRAGDNYDFRGIIDVESSAWLKISFKDHPELNKESRIRFYPLTHERKKINFNEYEIKFFEFIEKFANPDVDWDNNLSSEKDEIFNTFKELFIRIDDSIIKANIIEALSINNEFPNFESIPFSVENPGVA